MKATSISETKTHLASLIDEVRRGETIVILDDGKPVARIVSADEETIDAGDRLNRLEKQGVIKKAQATPELSFLDAIPTLPKTCETPLAALLEERESAR